MGDNPDNLKLTAEHIRTILGPGSDVVNGREDLYLANSRAENDCFTGKGEDYRGYKDTTVNNFTCLSWSKQTKAVEDENGEFSGYWMESDGAAMQGVGNHNYCRNPDGTARPWCYTTNNARRWDHCFDAGKAKQRCSGKRVTHRCLSI